MSVSENSRFAATIVFVSILLISGISEGGPVDDDVRRAVRTGIDLVGAAQNDPGLCAITDAGYVYLNGGTTERFADMIAEETGCSIGKNNLLFLHRVSDYPLKIVLFNKNNSLCMVVTCDGETVEQSEPVSLGFEPLGDTAHWEHVQEVIGGPDAFSITVVTNAWAGGVPHDFLKCVELHNHICPGITSGYFIARYIGMQYPRGNGSRMYISCPPWCKDDAIQTILDLTPGKKHFFVKALSDAQKESLRDDSAAGIFIIRENRTGGGKAVVISYDWDKAAALSGATGFEGIQQRIKVVTGLVPYIDKPELLVNVLHEAAVTDEQISRMTEAGINPYEEIRFIKE